MDAKGPESVFFMKPVSVIEAAARELVTNQFAIAQIRKMPVDLSDDDPQSGEIRADAAAVLNRWLHDGLPNLAATFRLALEVLDTHGPDGVDVEDGVDAAIWNNKYFVWREEFAASEDGDTPPH